MNAADWWPALDKAGFHVLRVLLSVLWQSSVLLAAVGVIAYALRRRRASVRHAVWTAAILVAPLLPLLGWVASSTGTPQAEIPVIPIYATWRAEPAEPATELPAATSAVEEISPVVLPVVPRPDKFSPLSYPWALAFLGYAAGAVFLLSLVNVGRIRLGRWVRRGKAITNPRVVEVFEAARGRFQIGRGFAVVESEHAHAPMTIGTLHPAILLPAGLAEKLSDSELEAVAIHELAHVKRRDALLLTVLSFVRAVLFFHPLVWLGCRQVSTLAESACDDAVLDATGEPVSYAKMLTRLAEGLPRRSLSTELAAGIVLSRSAFLRRVTAILSDRRARIRKLSRWALAATVLAGVVSIALAAALPLKEKATQVPEGMSTRTDEAPAREVRADRSEEVHFGPVIERVVNPSDDRKDRFIDLDTGNLFDAPESEMSLTELKAWAAERGIDAVADGVLGGLEMLVFPAKDNSVWDWQTIPEGEMLRNLTQGDGGTPVPIHAEGGLPATWFFKTREGGIGILQIVGHPKKPAGPGVNPHSIKIQYKLLGDGEAAKEGVEKIREGGRDESERGSVAEGKMLVVPTVGIGEVKFGMTINEVKRLWGEPDKVASGSAHIYYSKGLTVYAFKRTGVVASAICFSSKSMRVSPWSPIFGPRVEDFEGKTAEGIGIWSTEAEVMAAYGEPTTITQQEDGVTLNYDAMRMQFSFANGEVIWMLVKGDRSLLKKRLDETWGAAVKGVQCRLRGDKKVWNAGEVPTFKADVRNQGTREFAFVAAQCGLGLEFDGDWYSWGLPVTMPTSLLSPGQQHNDIEVTLSDSWRGLVLSPGEHTIRVALDGAASNSVVIEILPTLEGDLAKEAVEKIQERAPEPVEGEMLIVPKVGIGEVKFGMTLDEVRDVWGEPDGIGVDVGGTYHYSYYPSRGIRFLASTQSGIVTHALCDALSTAGVLPLGSKFEDFRGKTAEGIGLGSTEEEIMEAYGKPSERQPWLRFLGLAIMKYEGLGMKFMFREGKVAGMVIRGDEEMLRKREAEEALEKIQERAPEPAEKEAISASELWDLQRAYFEGISSFHFDVTTKIVVTGEDERSSRRPGEYEMKTSLTVEGEKYRTEGTYTILKRLGEKYRTEITSEDKATGETNRMIWAFDGSKYQHLVGSYLHTEEAADAKKVGFHSHSLTNMPIFLAYGSPWAESVGVAQLNLEVLKKPETWAATAKVTRGMRRDRMFGQDGVVVTLGGYEKSFGAERSREIFFAQDPGYFPIYWEIKRVSSQGESLGTWRVSETKLVDGTVVPIVIEGEEPSLGGGRTISVVMVVDPGTVKINEKVDPEIFTALVPEDDIQSGKIKVVDVNAQKKLR